MKRNFKKKNWSDLKLRIRADSLLVTPIRAKLECIKLILV